MAAISPIASPPNREPGWKGPMVLNPEPADMPVAGCRHAEMALCYLALTCPEHIFDPTDICEMDFYWDDTRYIFGEFLRMREAGWPSEDAAVHMSWFKKPEAVERMRAAKLDWFDDQGKPCVFADIFQLVIDGGFATIANVDWYRAEVRRWRVVRGIRLVSWRLSELINSDPTQGSDILGWLEQSLESLKTLDATISASESSTPERVLR